MAAALPQNLNIFEMCSTSRVQALLSVNRSFDKPINMLYIYMSRQCTLFAGIERGYLANSSLSLPGDKSLSVGYGEAVDEGSPGLEPVPEGLSSGEDVLSPTAFCISPYIHLDMAAGNGKAIPKGAKVTTAALHKPKSGIGARRMRLRVDSHH